MKLGYCTGFEHLGLLEQAGISNLELTVAAIMGWSEVELQENLRILAASPVKLESCNCLISGFSLYEDEDFVKTRAYFARVLPRLGAVGIRKAVFGSGGYRRMPEGMTVAEARPRLMAFLQLLSELCKPYGITIAIEPLIKKSTNILLTAKETAPYVRELNLPNMQLLIDFGHFFNENELLTEMENYRGMLVHTHIANPINRRNPMAGDGFDYQAWIRALRGIGYEGLLVSECVDEPNLMDGILSFRRMMDDALAARD